MSKELSEYLTWWLFADLDEIIDCALSYEELAALERRGTE